MHSFQENHTREFRELGPSWQKRLTRTIGEIYEPELGLQTFLPHLFTSLAPIRADATICRELHTSGTVRASMSSPLERAAERVKAYAQYMDCHPFFGSDVAFFQGRALMNGDFFSPRVYRDLPIYREAIYDSRHSLNVRVPVGEWKLCIGFHRTGGSAFRERERQFLEATLPHIARSYHHARLKSTREMSHRERVEVRCPELSSRQQDVFAWVIEGKSNAEISLILSISIETVKTHVKAIFRRLGIANRAEAVLYIYANKDSANRINPW